MLALGASQVFYGSATTAQTVNYTIGGLLMNTASPPVATGYSILAQGQFSSTVSAVLTNSGSQTSLISAISLFNTSATVVQVVNLYGGGTAPSNQLATITLPAGGWAEYEDGNGWQVYNSSGLLITGGVFYVGGLGTPSNTAGAITVGTDTVVNGTLIGPIAAGSMGVYPAVNSRYRFTCGAIKTTAAGTNTWAAKIKVGTAGTLSDSLIASWTSGTNTGVVDQGIYIFEVVITALGTGTSATATCSVFSVNAGSSVTGLSMFPAAPTSTAGFNSTVANYLHIDFNAGTSAVMTAWGMAEQLK